MNKLIITIVAVAFVLTAGVTVSAHHMGQSQSKMGPGMMGSGMMGHHQGMMGPGMMGPGMMGPGMMGPGMMGHGMMGPGMMGHGTNRLLAIYTLSLSDDQQKKINKIKTDLRKANWGLKGAMMDHQDKLTDLYSADDRDASAISEVYSEIFKLKQQMIENALDADNKAYALLDDEQRKQLKQSSRSSRHMRSSGHRHMMMN